MQPGRPPIPQEETCPIPENLLGQLYRASSHGLDSLIATVPAKTRAMLALYCHRRTARAAPEDVRVSSYIERKHVSLSRGTIMQVVIDQDLV